jgi:hypothetical protein
MQRRHTRSVLPMLSELEEFEWSSANLPQRFFLLLLIKEARCPRNLAERLHLTNCGCKLLRALYDRLYCALLPSLELNNGRQEEMALRARAYAMQRSSAVVKQGALF